MSGGQRIAAIVAVENPDYAIVARLQLDHTIVVAAGLGYAHRIASAPRPED
jgi:hypothetical protein